MTLFDIRVCWNCRNLWVEDDHQQDDVDRCPTCGAHASNKPCQDTFYSGATRPASAPESYAAWGDADSGYVVWDDYSGPVQWD